MVATELNSPRLILSPIDKNFQCGELTYLINQLLEEKFLGADLGDESGFHCFDYGDDYLSFISYLGCSPAVTSDTGSDKTENFISVRQFEQVQFAFSSPIPPARCPHCQKTDPQWPQYLKLWQQNSDATHPCPQCGESFNFSDMRWKKNAGYGSLLIQVHGIAEQLAVPSPALLQSLETITNTAWHYFFADKDERTPG